MLLLLAVKQLINLYFFKTRKSGKEYPYLKKIPKNKLERKDFFAWYTNSKLRRTFSELHYEAILDLLNRYQIPFYVLVNGIDYVQVEDDGEIKIKWSKLDNITYRVACGIIILLLGSILTCFIYALQSEELTVMVLAIVIITPLFFILLYFISVTKELVAGNILSKTPFNSAKTDKLEE